MPILTRVNGVWKEVNEIYANVSGVEKEMASGWVNVSGVWKRFYMDAIPIPAGAVIPYYAAGSIPTGWSTFTDEYKLIRGWDGTSGSISATGGSNSISFTSVAAGAHTGGAGYINGQVSGTYSIYAAPGGYSAGNHNHIVTGTLKPPKIIRTQLIVADSDVQAFPANALALGVTSFSGLTEITATQAHLMGYSNSGASVGITLDQTMVCSTNSAGSHRHHGNGTTGSSKMAYPQYTANGAHAHSFSVTDVVYNLQRIYLKAFTDVSAAFPVLPGMIVGWQSVTPPTGWQLCDGSNGSVDLRNYFICIDSTETPGNSTGDNTVSFTYNTGAGGSHHHATGSQKMGTASAYHTNNVTHSHSGSVSGLSAQYPFRRLAFIQAL